MARLVTVLMCLVLCACSVREAQVDNWDAQQIKVAALDNWSFRGRMAVNVEDDPDASGQVAVAWRQQEAVSEVRLSGPLGSGAWEILWQPDRITVADTAGERSIQYTGPDAAEQFMQAELGWAFPADSIRYWVRGLPAPAPTDLEQRAGDGQLISFRQYGWNVMPERYGDFAGLALPTRVTMEGRGVRLRVVVSRWKTGG